MTREDFYGWLIAYGCEQEPIEGVNHTARQIKIRCPQTGRYCYLDLPVDNREMPDYQILHACKMLNIQHPDCVSHEETRFSTIRDNHQNGRHNR